MPLRSLSHHAEAISLILSLSFGLFHLELPPSNFHLLTSNVQDTYASKQNLFSLTRQFPSGPNRTYVNNFQGKTCSACILKLDDLNAYILCSPTHSFTQVIVLRKCLGGLLFLLLKMSFLVPDVLKFGCVLSQNYLLMGTFFYPCSSSFFSLYSLLFLVSHIYFHFHTTSYFSVGCS